MSGARNKLSQFSPALLVFDKDGTLIDFHTMWSGWVVELARRLEKVSGRPVAERLYQVMEVDPSTGQVMPEGHLAVVPMAGLHAMTVELMRELGLPDGAAEAAVAEAWFIPDPLALARPCADLHELFGALRERGIKIAVATSDDRAPTEATLAGLGVLSFVDALVCADDGLPVKPAADMLLSVCRKLGVPPEKTVMVGDTVADLKMGRAAGVGRVIGVLTGAGTAELLAPHADVLLNSIADLA